MAAPISGSDPWPDQSRTPSPPRSPRPSPPRSTTHKTGWAPDPQTVRGLARRDRRRPQNRRGRGPGGGKSRKDKAQSDGEDFHGRSVAPKGSFPKPFRFRIGSVSCNSEPGVCPRIHLRNFLRSIERGRVVTRIPASPSTTTRSSTPKTCTGVRRVRSRFPFPPTTRPGRNGVPRRVLLRHSVNSRPAYPRPTRETPPAPSPPSGSSPSGRSRSICREAARNGRAVAHGGGCGGPMEARREARATAGAWRTISFRKRSLRHANIPLFQKNRPDFTKTHARSADGFSTNLRTRKGAAAPPSRLASM